MKSLKLFYSGSSVVVRFSATTTRDELLAGICETIGVAPLSPLRFRDEDGNIVLLSASIPSDLELHVAVEAGFAPAVEVARFSQPPENWARWARLHENAKLVEGNSCTFTTVEMCNPFYALSAPLPSQGQYYAVIDAEKHGKEEGSGRPCCVTVGVVNANLVSLPGSHIGGGQIVGDEFLMRLIAVGLGPKHYLSSSTTGGTPMRVGILINMDAHEMTIVNHDDPKNGAVRFTNLPNCVCVALQGPKHGIKAKITQYAIPVELLKYQAPVAGESQLKKLKEIEIDDDDEEMEYEEDEENEREYEEDESDEESDE